MSVQKFLDKIKNGRYGADITDAIIGGIKKCYDDASVNHDNANMEVKMARGTHNTLNDRLDNVDEIQAQTNAQLSNFYKKTSGLIDIKEYENLVFEENGVRYWDNALKQAIHENENLMISADEYHFKNHVVIPDKELLIEGQHGSKLHSNTNLFVVNTHKKITIKGLTFETNGNAIKFDCTPSHVTNTDFMIENCTFNTPKDVFAIYLKFAREGVISQCIFNGSGIYRTSTVNTIVTSCTFNGGKYGFVDEPSTILDEQVFTCGALISHSTFLGYEVAIQLEGGDYFNISDNLIDFNDSSVVIVGYDAGVLNNNLITSNSEKPCIEITGPVKASDVDVSRFIRIINNSLGGYTDENTFTCIKLKEASSIDIAFNDIRHYIDCGIIYEDCDNLTISNNQIIPKKTGNYSVSCSKLDSDMYNNKIYNNTMINGLNVRVAKYYCNIGINTKVNGYATLRAGYSFEVINFTEQLDFDPQFYNVKIVAQSSLYGAYNLYCSFVTRSAITINVDGTSTEDIKVAYEVSYCA